MRKLQNLTRRAVGILLVDTVIYAAIFSIFIFLVSSKNSLGDYLSTLAYVSLVFGVYRFGLYYRSNVELHSELIEKIGDEYLAEAEKEMESTGLRKMIYQKWFKQKGETVWPGKLD